MTPVFLKPYSSNVSHDIGDQRDHQDQNKEQHLKLFLSLNNEGSSSSSSSSLAVSPSPTFLSPNACQDQSTGVFQMHELRDQKETVVDLDNGGSGKYWMSSKMRLIHKMANPETPAETDQAASGGHSNNTSAHNHNYHHNHYVNDNINKGVVVQKSVDSIKQDKTQITFSFSHTKNNIAGLRVCSDCNTTSTPLWRSGPRGPKSLCNACGIRQRKSRRAMAEATLAGRDSDYKTKSSAYNYNKALIIKEKKTRPSNIAHHHYKSKLKLRTQRLNGNKLCFRDLSFSLNDNHSLFPQDVAEAAVLLMELSCHGLVHS